MSTENPLVPSSVVKRRRDDNGNATPTDIRENPLIPTGERRKVVSVRRSAPTSSTTSTVSASSTPKKTTSERILPADVKIVNVKGNPKVQRCVRCMTFVKAGAPHSLAECNARLARKANKKPRLVGKKRKFRMTPKRLKYLREAVRDHVTVKLLEKPIDRLKTWLANNEKKCSKRPTKLIKSVINTYSDYPPAKTTSRSLRHAGL